MGFRASRTSESAHQYVRRLQDSGMVVLGSGHFSMVLTKPKAPYVLRVNTGHDYDVGWEEFICRLKRCDIAKKNPHFARYGEVRKFRHDVTGDRYLVGEVERLYDPASVDFFGASSIIDRIILSIENKSSGRAAKIPYIPKTLYEAVEFLMQIRDADKSKRLRFDIHDCNIMMRKDGELVITDPFSYDFYT